MMMMLATEQEPTAGTRRVLLIEDDDAHAEVLWTVVQQSGRVIDMQRASDVEEASCLLREMARGEAEPPDLVLLDLKLPRGSGFDVLALLKSDPVLQSIPVVVLTTSAALGDRMRATAEHANSYLVKPLEFTHFERMMLETLDYWLGWHRSS